MRANILSMPICCNSQVPQNGAGMYPSRDVMFNYRVSYARVKRPIPSSRFSTVSATQLHTFHSPRLFQQIQRLLTMMLVVRA